MLNECLVRIFSLGFLIFGGILWASNENEPYPNELIAYKLYDRAKWNKLKPLVSTMADVRRVLGTPRDPRDLAAYSKPYPGDDMARQPVFDYVLDAKWKALVYFGRNCEFLPAALRVKFADRVCSIDLIPLKRESFSEIMFPPAFRKQHVTSADAAWDEYADSSGLAYAVYTTRTPYGTEIPGDLNRIVYGPSVSNIESLLELQDKKK